MVGVVSHCVYLLLLTFEEKFLFVKVFFLMWSFLSLYWICYNIASVVLCFVFFGHEACGIPTSDWTSIGRQSLNHWPPGKFPYLFLFKRAYGQVKHCCWNGYNKILQRPWVVLHSYSSIVLKVRIVMSDGKNLNKIFGQPKSSAQVELGIWASTIKIACPRPSWSQVWLPG